MNFSTPGGIFPTAIVVASDSEAFVLGHPVADGPVNMDYSVIFRIVGLGSEIVLQLPYEITGLAYLDGRLFAVDLEADLHEFHNSKWIHWRDVGQRCARINALRVVRNTLMGVGGDGLIYEWLGSSWKAMVVETPELYLYDIAESADGTLYVSGEKGFLGVVSGHEIQKLDIGVNTDISCVLPMDDGRFLLTGWNATILIGSADELTLLEVGDRQDAFANAVMWKGLPLVATVSGPLAVDAHSATLHSGQQAHRLASGFGQLLAQHDTGVAAYGADSQWKDVSLSFDLPKETRQ